MHAVPGLVAPAFISNKNHAHLLQAGTKGTITAAGRRVCSSPTCYVNTLILPPRRLPARPGICCEIRRRFARRILATGRLISFGRKIKNQLFFIPSERRCDTWWEEDAAYFAPFATQWVTHSSPLITAYATTLERLTNTVKVRCMILGLIYALLVFLLSEKCEWIFRCVLSYAVCCRVSVCETFLHSVSRFQELI